MATRKVNSKILIKDIVFDEELYPRSVYNWQTAYDYSMSMKTGAVFPPIILALFNGKKYLVDGKHRMEAYKVCKIKEIPCVIYTGWNKRRIYEEAVKYNIAHGRILSPYEKRQIALKLRQWKYPASKISDLIQVPPGKLESFIGTRLINSITGEVEYESIVKSELKHLVGGEYSPERIIQIKKDQKMLNMVDQVYLLEQMFKLLKQKLINRRNKKVSTLLKQIKSII